jgi:ribonuclease HI
MRASDPHFLLYSEALCDSACARHWRFVLQPVSSGVRLTEADSEPEARLSRLELLAVVRGLEALEQPSRVTLLTGSRYVIRGIRRSLSQWRERSWRWERFGQLVPIRDHDLWRRVDRALQIHDVECCEWRNVVPAGGENVSPQGAAACHVDADELQQVAAAVSGMEVAGELALLIVPRADSRRTTVRQATFWPFHGTWQRLRRGFWEHFAAIWRPTFTRAA